jgi:bifunctional non-homologous end joining protein LigD
MATRSGRTAGSRRTAEALIEPYLPPMLATLAAGPPARPEEWLYELKYDGFRAVAAVTAGRAVVRSRNSLDLGERFPDILKQVAKIGARELVVDGEIVALDAKGVPRFQLLQRGAARVVFIVFDLLWLEGHDLTALPIESRRELLEKVLADPPRGIELAEQVEGDVKSALDGAELRGYEGLIGKRRGTGWEPRRSKQWIKLKVQNIQELAIVGFTPSKPAPKEIGALLLGVMEKGEMRFAGKVGTGFSAKQRVELRRMLSRDEVPKPAVAGAPRMRDAVWVKPKYVAQVRFTEWTSDGRLRHPAFLGLRDDKSPDEAVREAPASPPASAAGPAGEQKPVRKTKVKEKSHSIEVRLSSPDRLLYPRDGITKKDVAAYYEAMAEPMIRALDGRPLALEHWNDGIDQPSWFHQNIGREGQSWMTTVETPTRTSKRKVRHLVADRPETLRWLAQMSVLTLHMWSSRAGSLESPDWLVFDLDPAKGKGIEQAVEAALVLRRLFEELSIPSVPKTSGKRGLHVLVPLQRGRHTHEEAVSFACSVAAALSEKLDFATVERSLSARKGRLYFDCLQNGYGKTIVAPYSLRGADGAPVSAPLAWSEVTRRLDPSRYNLKTMPVRLAKKGDLFAPLFEKGIVLPRLEGLQVVP